jgi:hypothetical protein
LVSILFPWNPFVGFARFGTARLKTMFSQNRGGVDIKRGKLEIKHKVEGGEMAALGEQNEQD